MTSAMHALINSSSSAFICSEIEKKGILKNTLSSDYVSLAKSLAVTFSDCCKDKYLYRDEKEPLKIKKTLRSSNRIIVCHGTFSKSGLIGKGTQIIHQIGEINKLLRYEGGFFKENTLHGCGFRIQFEKNLYSVQIGRFVKGHLDGIGILLSPHEGCIVKLDDKKSTIELVCKIASIKDLLTESGRNEELANLLATNSLYDIIDHYASTLGKVEEIIKKEREEEDRLLKSKIEFKSSDLLSPLKSREIEKNEIHSSISNQDFLSSLQRANINKTVNKSLDGYSIMKIRLRRCLACFVCKTKITPAVV